MGKRLRLDVHLRPEDKGLVIDFFKYSKSLRATTKLVQCLFHRKGKRDNITRSSVRNWIKTYYPEAYRSVHEEQKVKRIQKKLENASKEEYDLRDLIHVGRR